MRLFHQIRSDYRRYRATGASWWLTIFYTQGFWASCIYRCYRATFLGIKNRTIRRILLPWSVLSKFMEIFTGIAMPVTADIGEGLYIGHFGGIFLPSHGSLGARFGVAGGDHRRGRTRRVARRPDAWRSRLRRPALDHRRQDHGRVGRGKSAGTVVTRSVPARAVVLGNPGRVISYEGSFDYVVYDGMEADPDRIASKNAVPPRAGPRRAVGPALCGLGRPGVRRSWRACAAEQRGLRRA